MIRGGLRVQFLEFLRTKGLTGLDDFLYTFISSLLEKKQMRRDLERQRLHLLHSQQQHSGFGTMGGGGGACGGGGVRGGDRHRPHVTFPTMRGKEGS
jgi:hypothetical protein